ncbi:tRNA (adenosine(37)-N6)-dimethylallyltransferase MiaA [Acidocella sp.]|uniref:tRNA (adenosine(37)-N6)-dimethylallyltransferase MiaA n=1 Tax=Acidocella sp. TaxID=50710 RepID=UPI002627B648|nr:tRNA (adenosine(37)-N6)-dimethylallyltransferase MiaA [Acidocella sp.]
MTAPDRPDRAIPQRPLALIAGPTASGKSALALALATRLGGTIINADAMQCYAALRVLTARPSPEDESQAPHRLYGVRAITSPTSAAWWREAALSELNAAAFPIICGGTGLYFSALIHGLNDIPAPTEEARREARALLAALGPEALHAKLDPPTAARLKPQDSQRIARAYEVLRSTGQGLAHWQSRPTTGLQGFTPRLILLDPPREALKDAIAHRFDTMLALGALDEVRALLAHSPDPSLPLMRAHGVPELAAHLQGEITLPEARARAIAATSRYTKRQATWFRHQKLVSSADMQIIHSRITSTEQLSESFIANLTNFINQAG